MEMSDDDTSLNITSSNMDVSIVEDEDIYTLMTTIPQDLDRRLNEVVRHVDISKLANAFESCLVMHWRDFGERWLNIRNNQTENIDADKNRRSEKILEMFHTWKEIHGEQATVRNIINAFDEAKLIGIKQLWFTKYKSAKEDAIAQFLQARNKRLYELSQAFIPDENWHEHMIKLRIEDKEIDVSERCHANQNSRSRKRKEILHMFENRYGYSKEIIDHFESAFSQENCKPVRRLPTTRDTTKTYPFYLREIGRVRKCQGCEAYFDNAPSKDNMVIAHIEWVTYKTKDGELVSDFIPGHYHYNEICVRANHKNFNIDRDLVRNGTD